MAIYLKKFENHTQYENYINGSGAILPNVSICTTEGDVHYNPYAPPAPGNIITYAATAKLPETTSTKNGGLHTNAFNTTIISHTFENGVGTIEFDDDVTSVGDYAFNGCSGITSIDIPNTVTTIGNSAFSGMTSCTRFNSDVDGVFNIHDSVVSIGNYVFTSCSGMTSCTIGSGVTSIGIGVFNACSSITSITSNATTAPIIDNNTFYRIKTDGTLYVPQGSSGYDVWMRTDSSYLGYSNWIKVEQ